MDSDFGTTPAVILVSTSGVIIKIPTCQFSRLMQRGERRFTLEFAIDESTVAPAAVNGKDWLDTGAALRELMSDVDGIEPKAGRDRLLRAMKAKAFSFSGHGRTRRIEPASYALWVSRQRRRAVAVIENQESDERILRKRRELGLE